MSFLCSYGIQFWARIWYLHEFRRGFRDVYAVSRRASRSQTSMLACKNARVQSVRTRFQVCVHACANESVQFQAQV